MLIDTHCHLNIMVKKAFDVPLTEADFGPADAIVNEAAQAGVTKILNVGTSLVESINCFELAKRFPHVFATIGIHPNDLTAQWKDDLKKLSTFLTEKEELKIVAIGECGIDKHYPDYNLEWQRAAFKEQIELALEHDLALVVHTRDAPDETLRCLEEYKDQGLRGTIHCFSGDLGFAQESVAMGFVLGIGGTVTYPNNNQVRSVVSSLGLKHIILETDAPFLPPQVIRGKRNHPLYIKAIAEYLAQHLGTSFEEVAQKTTHNALAIFQGMK